MDTRKDTPTPENSADNVSVRLEQRFPLFRNVHPLPLQGVSLSNRYAEKVGYWSRFVLDLNGIPLPIYAIAYRSPEPTMIENKIAAPLSPNEARFSARDFLKPEDTDLSEYYSDMEKMSEDANSQLCLAMFTDSFLSDKLRGSGLVETGRYGYSQLTAKAQKLLEKLKVRLDFPPSPPDIPTTSEQYHLGGQYTGLANLLTTHGISRGFSTEVLIIDNFSPGDGNEKATRSLVIPQDPSKVSLIEARISLTNQR